MLVGDTPLDVRAAREAGARVAVATGFSDVDELRASEPDAVLETSATPPRRCGRSAADQDFHDRAALGRLGAGGLLAGEQRVERLAQPGRVQARIVVVLVGRAAVAQPALAVDHEDVRRRLGAVGARDLLRLVAQVGIVQSSSATRRCIASSESPG